MENKNINYNTNNDTFYRLNTANNTLIFLLNKQLYFNPIESIY